MLGFIAASTYYLYWNKIANMYIEMTEKHFLRFWPKNLKKYTILQK